MPERDSQDADKYIVRFPSGMRDRIKAAAAANGRSLNAEIVQRLQASFEAPGQGDAESVRALRELADERARSLEDAITLQSGLANIVDYLVRSHVGKMTAEIAAMHAIAKSVLVRDAARVKPDLPRTPGRS